MRPNWIAITFAALGLVLLFSVSGHAANADRRTEGSTVVTSFGFVDTASPAAVSATTTTARTASDFPRRYDTVRLYCTGDAHFKFGDSTVTAAVTDTPIQAKGPGIIVNAGDNLRVAFILDATTATCWATVLR